MFCYITGELEENACGVHYKEDEALMHIRKQDDGTFVEPPGGWFHPGRLYQIVTNKSNSMELN